MALAPTPRALLALLFEIAVVIELSYGAVYKVGDSAGWTTLGNIDYDKWAATKSFQIGDVILFVYHPEVHNVMRVTQAMYNTCNASAPIDTYTTGNDSITIKTQGHHFFLCGIPGHCQVGQKVDINVLNSTAIESPGPSTNNAASLNPSMALNLQKLGFAVFAIIAYAFV